MLLFHFSKAQLKRRTGGGATTGGGGGALESEGSKDREELRSPQEEMAPLTSQLSRSPRSPRSGAFLAGAARVLPPIGGNDGG